MKLYQHQREAVDFILGSKLMGTLLWHEVGLGKTLSALSAARSIMPSIRQTGARAPKILTIIPKSLMAQWKSETLRFANDLYSDMIFLPYSQMESGINLPKFYDIRMIIADECHFMKTPETQRVRNFCKMLQEIGTIGARFQGGKVITLSGTPMVNHAAEIYSNWALCTSPNLVEAANRIQDKVRYENWKTSFSKQITVSWDQGAGKRKRKKFGTRSEGVANEDKFSQLLGPVVHFRQAAQCLDLPKKQRIPIDVGLEDDRLLADADIEKPEYYMALLERLARAKTPHAIEWIKEFWSANNLPLLVFCPYTFPLEEINKAFRGKFGLITGDQTMAERTANIEKLKKGHLKGLAMTYKAGGFGLNLQFVHQSLYLGYPWTPSDITQAMGRTHRNGQTERTMHYFLTSGQNDMRVLDKVMAKEEAIATVEGLLLEQNPYIRNVDDFI